MRVIKRNNTIDIFNPSKIRQSILNASNSSGILITDMELEYLTREITRKLNKIRYEDTSSYEIYGIVIEVLKYHNYTNIYNQYINN